MEINGISAADIVDNPAALYDMMLPEYRKAFIESENQALDSGERFDCEVPMLRPNGEVRWYRISSAPRPGPNGDTVWDGVQVDITDRINAETTQKKAVAEKEEIAAEREAVLGQLAEGVIVTNAAGEIVYVNRAASNIHGVSKLDVPVGDYSVTYRLFTEKGDPYPSRQLPLARAVLDRETVSNAVWRIRRSDNTEVIAIGSASPVYRENGSFLGAVLTLRDDTARYDAERALRQSETRFRGLFEQSPLLIHVFDPSEKTVAINPALERAVQAIASQTALKSDPQLFARAFGERLQGLAASHDLLVKNSWEEIDLRELFLSQLSHFKSLVGNRISISGRPLNVSPTAAQTFGMTIHELATNAGKYGSLSNESGTVDIKWEFIEVANISCVEISWTERNGPPVQKPSTAGFGTVLIERTAASALRGSVKLEYTELGLEWLLTIPAETLLNTRDAFSIHK